MKAVPYSSLTKQINTFVQKNSQSQDLFSNKLRFRHFLLTRIRNVFPQGSLHFTGSTVTGFGSQSSDIDLCLMIPSNQQRKKKGGRRKNHQYAAPTYATSYEEKIHFLREVRSQLRGVGQVDLVRAINPILKLKDVRSGLDCDININSDNCLRNTHLLRTYSHIDPRVRPLVMVVKHWARNRGFNEARYGGLSSYALSLMCLHFMQCQCTPPVVPPLQLLYPEYFNIPDVVEMIKMTPWEEIEWKSTNIDASNGQLLVEFFKYFSEVRWDEKVVCVYNGNDDFAEGGERERMEKRKQEALNALGVWKYNTHMKLLDPFEFYNTARSVQAIPFKMIRKQFHEASKLMESNPCLNELLNLEKKDDTGNTDKDIDESEILEKTFFHHLKHKIVGADKTINNTDKNDEKNEDSNDNNGNSNNNQKSEITGIESKSETRSVEHDHNDDINCCTDDINDINTTINDNDDIQYDNNDNQSIETDENTEDNLDRNTVIDSLQSTQLPSIHLPNSTKFSSYKNSLEQYCIAMKLTQPLYTVTQTTNGYLAGVTYGNNHYQCEKLPGTRHTKKNVESFAAYKTLQHLGYLSGEEFTGKKFSAEEISHTVKHEGAKSALSSCSLSVTYVVEQHVCDGVFSFTATVSVDGDVYRGEPCPSKKAAEMSAAHVALVSLGLIVNL